MAFNQTGMALELSKHLYALNDLIRRLCIPYNLKTIIDGTDLNRCIFVSSDSGDKIKTEIYFELRQIIQESVSGKLQIIPRNNGMQVSIPVDCINTFSLVNQSKDESDFEKNIPLIKKTWADRIQEDFNEDLDEILKNSNNTSQSLSKGVNTTIAHGAKKGLATRENVLSMDSNPIAYVHSSTNYKDFFFLPFNRKRVKKHTREIIDSIERHGVIGFVTIVITDCIDGVLRKWIVDGQHRFDAFQKLGLPVLYTIAFADSKKEIVKLIADLNKTSRRWATRNFLFAWESIEIDDYKVLRNTLEETKLPITFLFEVFTGRDRTTATKLFQDGEFVVVNKEESLQYIQYVMDIKKFLPRSKEVYSGFVTFFRQRSDYDHSVFLKGFIEGKIDGNEFVVGDKRESIVKKITSMYQEIKSAA